MCFMFLCLCRLVVQLMVCFVFMQGHMQREKKACRLGPPFCLTEMEIMYERSHVLGLFACIPGEGVADSMPNEEDDHVEELSPDQFTTPSPSTRN
jgi:hypothetical protein